MKKYITSPSVNLREKLLTILFGYVLVFLWALFIRNFLFYLNPPTSSPISFNPFEEVPPLKYMVFMCVLFAPIWEELAFRYGPGLIVKQMGNGFLLPIMIISSAIFGWGHGRGAESIMIQGVMGFVFFWVYAKNGFSYWSSVLLHASWNATCMFLL